MANETSSVNENTDKYVLFEENIRKLFTACNNVKNAVSSRKVITKNNPIYDSFNQFVNTYEDIGAEDTMILFEEFYNKKKYQILSRKDTWIGENSRSTIEFPSKKKTKRKKAIMLSVFYRHAKELSIEAEREVTEFGRDEEAENVYLPEVIIYPLLEIFVLLAPSSDMEKLNIYREEIKADLPDTDITPSAVNPLQGMGGLGNMLNSALGGINFADIQKNFTENNGGEGGEGSDGSGQGQFIPPGMDLGDTISGLFKNPESKGVIDRVSGKFQNMKNVNDLGGIVGDLLSDKELQNSVKRLAPAPEPLSDGEGRRMVEEAKSKYPDSQSDSTDKGKNKEVVINKDDIINSCIGMNTGSSCVDSVDSVEQTTTMINNDDLVNSNNTTTSIVHMETNSSSPTCLEPTPVEPKLIESSKSDLVSNNLPPEIKGLKKSDSQKVTE